MEMVKSFKNPLRNWLEAQPRSLTMKALAEELDIGRTYIVDLTREECTVTPSVSVMLKIEKRTGVSVAEFHAFAEANRRKRKAKAA